MNRPSAGLYLGFLLAVLAIQALLLLGKGILLIDQHEGDALHVLQIALRMGEGQWPHLDFTTPIGLLAFMPISWLISLGVGAGHALMGGMILFSVLLIPAIWWVGFSRLPSWLAYGLGGFLIVLTTALVYGGEVQVTSISMYYNRWAWAVAFLLVLVVILPASMESHASDGLVLGLGLAFLLLSKITFFVAFMPGVFIALVLRQHWVSMLVATLAGALVLAVVTLFGGVEFWVAYLGDLRLVSGSGIRPQPSASLPVLLVGPSFLAANLCLLGGIILLRQAGHMLEGLVLLVFTPAFVYATYQNWGNDPKWLILLAVILLALRPDRHVNNPFGWNVGRALGIVSLISLALILPSIYNLTFANLRHARMSREGFTLILPGAIHDDIAMETARVYAPERRTAFALRDPNMRLLGQKSANPPNDLLLGQPLELCKLQMGLVGVLHQMAKDLGQIAGIEGKTVFTADTFSNLWMFGATAPLPGGAPWYYGGDAGMRLADYILVPLCPVTSRARSLVLAEIAAQPDLGLREVMRNDLFILLERAQP